MPFRNKFAEKWAQEADLARTHPKIIGWHEWLKACKAFDLYESKKKKPIRMTLLGFLTGNNNSRYGEVLKDTPHSWHYRVTEEHYKIIMAGNSPYAPILYHIMWIQRYNSKKPKHKETAHG